MLLGGAFNAITLWTQEEMLLISHATGIACILLALGLLVGEFFGFGWLLHPWTVITFRHLHPSASLNKNAGGGQLTEGNNIQKMAKGQPRDGQESTCSSSSTAVTQSFSSGDLPLNAV